MKEKQFQTESKELLSLMINSIYSNKEIFLRELLSNASDAIDKYKFLQLRSEGKLPSCDYEIRIRADKGGRYLEVLDNGIGMNEEDIENNLGTIARSGSKAFLQAYHEAKEKPDIDIIGQFGVGFYSAFMVASKVEVETKKYGEPGYRFASDGVDTYSIEEADLPFEHGSLVRVYLKDDQEEEKYSSYLEEYRIEGLVSKYSDFIRYPIKMLVRKTPDEDETTDKAAETEDKTLNSMVPLWKKPKAEVTDEALADFYKAKFGAYEEPLLSLYLKIDGVITYDALIYIPLHAPRDLYSENYEKGLDLYAKGVFIQERNKDLIPDYLKFVRGLVDSSDVSLNISREMLQKDPAIRKIRDSIEKKILDKLKDLKKNDIEKYRSFYAEFGPFLEYQIYASYGMDKEKLQDLLLFPTLNQEKPIGLDEYVSAMKEGQKNIFFAMGKSEDACKLLPEMEKFKKDGIDVLLCLRPIDEFCFMMMRDYDKKPFKNISETSQEDLSDEEKKELESLSIVHKRFLDEAKSALGEKVDEVAFSGKLVDSPCCITTKEGVSLAMEQTLKEEPGQTNAPKSIKVLEINPKHALFEAVADCEDDDKLQRFGKLYYDEAMMLEGFEVEDKKAFVENLNALLLAAKPKEE